MIAGGLCNASPLAPICRARWSGPGL